jgi:hypothetical protein
VNQEQSSPLTTHQNSSTWQTLVHNLPWSTVQGDASIEQGMHFPVWGFSIIPKNWTVELVMPRWIPSMHTMENLQIKIMFNWQFGCISIPANDNKKRQEKVLLEWRHLPVREAQTGAHSYSHCRGR